MSNDLGLPEFEAGRDLAEQLTATRMNQLVAAINSLIVRYSPGSRIRRTPWGQFITTRPGTPGGARAICPLEVSDASTTVGETVTLKLAIAWGTINGRQPDGFAAGGVPVFTITAPPGTSGYVLAKDVANLTTLQWTAPEVVALETEPDNTTTTAYHVIGTYALNAEENGFDVTTSCGNVVLAICDLAIEEP